ncbi:mitochondrial distribution and morphology protein 34 [Alternaria burnsii]|jgi:distribution and morphology protein 34|uniref:Mitochondrial distribution and morphology protein 34 n=5 Tax=Alternaria sect. Alternaria TaxID=2499237 RepID=A0A4Q4NPD3_ALTAL|nr:Mitochondrial distribution and morphology protein 34 [Alternaria arborescens]XP_038790400.1 mitochondrial distribution and morphology protein 34 [Alternaria burnsii]XP_051584958.1 ERMES complex subunit [Alternaria postmessia]KAB2110576.1 Mitochondrial distribution and morphology protein 34 [Alternaria gaisen]KAH6861502.1 mitochondrial distribution and morphology protein 34 [Alternaria alternata]RYN55662.1 Mitochondrial distribution and morphology protein 34 [Alternaria tenuissima]KAF768041
MAFNFNWSPLIADTSRARDMLTTALNKSPKPPIIVDDIIVTELNLGTTPPELEILEIGDLAEDRFRGIFKMSYAGDAFLTLKTKVQANPLKTYLSNKPDFASPQPLAASSGLTIPLQITLSNIRLSGFVILVFSKQKGLTLVFRNDPLESLKVSSTFDSIPFVRDYLQKEIEGQLRVLFMEDLPAIIHRLSLRMLSPEYQEIETEERLEGANDTTAAIDPLASPPQDAVDAFGNPLDEAQISALSLDSGEIHASFSQKNILRLAALSESQRTLSLFTPGIRDAVFRAWAGHPDRPESGAATPALTQGSLSRIQSTFGSLKSGASSVASGSTGNDTHSSRPTMASAYSTPSGLSLGSSRSRTGGMRKRKKRVVDLRKKEDVDSGVSTGANTPLPSAYASETSSVIPEEREAEEELATPPRSPAQPGMRFESRRGSLDIGTPKRIPEEPPAFGPLLAPAPDLSDAPKPPKPTKSKQTTPPAAHLEDPFISHSSSRRPPISRNKLRQAQQSTSPLLRSLSFDKVSSLSALCSPPRTSSPPNADVMASSGGILEQAWMTKMAQEIARKVQEEKDRSSRRPSHARTKTAPTGGFWQNDDEIEAPPAYVA